MAPTTRRSNGVARRPTARQPIPKNVLVELSTSHNKACMFCGQKEISEKLYGLLYQLNDVICHYFCILLSSRANQNGTDKEGIWGFLLKDIKAELTRGSKETCFYCKKKGATISCCGVKCRKVFHLPCGIKNGSMHQYFQSFKSFCKQHRITQAIDLIELQTSASVQCAICKDDVIASPLPTSIWAPCCKRNAWFHRGCIQDLALSAGYFFKCPLCNNVDTFKSRMLTLGIYIPSRDASWETVPNAFAELLERHSSCNAQTCLCPHQNRRTHQQEAGSWEIILCHTCGSNGTHRLCSSIKCDQRWLCTACAVVADKSKKRRLELPIEGNCSGISVLFEPRPNRLALNRPPPDDTISISSDDSNDSSIQCITYINPPQPQVIQTPQIRLPVIASYTSMSTGSTRSRFHRRFPISASQSKSLTYVISDSIDLTTDDDDGANNT
ncbi:PHD finger protein 7 isoform X2 [Acyrthosiphon pisum]|uniref:G2/M phase-specific E3 ubiquitin-protein ligase n=1 Tax=Acyrthosiphon pisum TaxID=7029 RepID=A0A8R1VZL4_ACYPI|nr:PHD finger protein 7 isoform X2 [Acyrthosiphon pisum]|eukprot:XP_001945076.2 PREDICTED: PHD finger protein 7 isoform X2 [Acyrthosiphon pisum]